MSLTADSLGEILQCQNITLFRKVREVVWCTVVYSSTDGTAVWCTMDHQSPGSHGEQLHSNRDTGTVTQRPGLHEAKTTELYWRYIDHSVHHILSHSVKMVPSVSSPNRWWPVIFLTLLRPGTSSGALLDKPPQIVKDLNQAMVLRTGSINR